MKKKLFIFSLLFSISITNAQVGIGTTTPVAQLDVVASNISTPTTTDGLLIPRVTAFPSPVTANQNGMLVFLTTAFSTNKVGFYYFDFPSLTWKWLAAGNNLSPWVNNNASSRIDVPFQSDGITARPLGNEAVILDNGNVGFGTLTPARHFTVYRDINNGTKFAVSNPNTGTAAFSQITAEASGSTAYIYSINSNYIFNPVYPWFTGANSLLQGTGVGGLSLAATDPSAYMNFFTGGRDESMRISAAGNVGIGTKNPVSPIHISGTSASILLERFGNGSHFVGRSANGTQAAPTPLLTNDIATRLSGWGYNGSSYWPVGIIDIMAEENQTTTAAGGYIKFTTNNAGGIASSEKMRITSNGNVGIGTTNPFRNLEVSTSARITSSNPFLEFNGTFASIPNLASFRIRSAGEIVMRSNENNASIPDWEIKYGSGTNANPNDVFYIGRRANASVVALDNLLLINSVGNVSIGNNLTPSEKLDVIGNIKLSGAIMPNNLSGTVGQVLTSSGAGIAPTWNNPSLLSYSTTGASTVIYNANLTQYTIRIFNAISEIRLPNASGNQGKIFIIIGSNGIGSKIFSTLGGAIYDDVTNTSLTILTANQRFMVQSDGTDWIVIGR